MDINKIKKILQIEKDKPAEEFEVIIKKVQTGEIIYQSKSQGGVICTMEKIIEFTDESVSGHHQDFIWGKTSIWIYCIDMLNRAVKKALLEIANHQKKQ